MVEEGSLIVTWRDALLARLRRGVYHPEQRGQFLSLWGEELASADEALGLLKDGLEFFHLAHRSDG
jgi:hypothetical protein